MRFLKECLIVLLMTAFSMTVSAKEPVTYNGYTLAEVTGNNITHLYTLVYQGFRKIAVCSRRNKHNADSYTVA